MIFWQKGDITVFPAEAIHWIYAIRKSGDAAAEILTDPWMADSAIWRFDSHNGTLTRVRDFNDYYEQPYSEGVIW